MIEIVRHVHQYVPAIEYEEEEVIPSNGQVVKVCKAIFNQVLLGGDQLTAVRAREARKAKVSSDIPSIRMEGIVPVAEDWHTKMNFIGVCIDVKSGLTCFLQDSAALRVEQGLRSLLHRQRNMGAMETCSQTPIGIGALPLPP